MRERERERERESIIVLLPVELKSYEVTNPSIKFGENDFG